MRPNVLWVVLDGLRADRLGCYGCERDLSPSIDAFARDATVFSGAVAQGGFSLPSHATMLTGLHPAEHGAHGLRDRLAPGIPLLPQRLRDAGYATTLIGGNPFFHQYYGLTAGFDSVEYINRAVPSLDVAAEGEVTICKPSALSKFVRYCGLADQGGRDIVRAVGGFADAHKDQPWFCYANLMTPHPPWTSNVPARWRWLRDRGTLLLSPYLVLKMTDPYWIERQGETMRQVHRDLYDASVDATDRLVGTVIDHLHRSGMLDNTIVILCSDHGEWLGERGILGHCVSLGGQLSRVPLIVRAPRTLSPGSMVYRPVELKDLAHNIVRLAGARDLEPSARPVLDLLGCGIEGHYDCAYAERIAMERVHDRAWRGPDGAENRPVRMVRDQTFEFLEYEDGEQLLFEAARDPASERDIADEEPRLVGQYRAKLHQIAASISECAAETMRDDSPEEARAQL